MKKTFRYREEVRREFWYRMMERWGRVTRLGMSGSGHQEGISTWSQSLSFHRGEKDRKCHAGARKMEDDDWPLQLATETSQFTFTGDTGAHLDEKFKQSPLLVRREAWSEYKLLFAWASHKGKEKGEVKSVGKAESGEGLVLMGKNSCIFVCICSSKMDV